MCWSWLAKLSKAASMSSACCGKGNLRGITYKQLTHWCTVFNLHISSVLTLATKCMRFMPGLLALVSASLSSEDILKPMALALRLPCNDLSILSTICPIVCQKNEAESYWEKCQPHSCNFRLSTPVEWRSEGRHNPAALSAKKRKQRLKDSH